MKKASHIVFLCILAAVFVSVPIVTVVTREKTSFYEQRNLAVFPVMTREAFVDGSYFSAVESYLSDHFAGRDSFLKADTALRLWMGKPVVNDLVVNSDALLNFHGYLHWDTGYLKTSSVNRAAAYRELQECVEAYGGTFCFLGMPYQTTYFADDYPAYMDNRLWNTDALRGSFREAMTAAGVPYIDMYEEYRALGFPREYYFKSDHHYSLQGGFAAYQSLCDLLREETDWTFTENISAADFELVTVDKPFLGSFNRQLYGLWDNADRVELAYVKADIPFTREDNGYAQEPFIYRLPAEADAYATYGVYMGGDMAETVIRTDRPDRPDILIYGDSYTNVLESLLWTQADELRSLDFRYYRGMSLRDYIAAYQPDIVICVRDETVFYSETENGIT